MTRITLALLLGLSMLVSLPVQAGGRHAHHGNHHQRHCEKHNRHHNKHQRHRAALNQRHYRGGHARHDHYGRYTISHPAPRIVPGAWYGPSGAELVIVYHPLPERRIGY